MIDLTLPAYAKVNLALKILDKREDGFHNLITLFQRISLADEVTFELLEKKGYIEYVGPPLTASPEQNLCHKAAKLFLEQYHPPFGIRIGLTKHIPDGAGLGGGSSDSATVLTGLARLAGVSPVDPPLLKMALSLGSDVPFFMTGESACLAEGRGELLTPVEPLPNRDKIVVLWSGTRIMTKWAYEKADELLTFDSENVKIVVREFKAHVARGNAGVMGNDFEYPVFTAVPELASARNKLLDLGAMYAGLSGSGSAVFGIFRDNTKAGLAVKEWREPWKAFSCRSL